MIGLFASLLVLAQAPSDFRGASYSNPAHWAEQDQPDVRSLVAPRGRAGELVMVMITAPRPASAEPSEELTAFVDQAERAGKRLERGAIERTSAGPVTVLAIPSRVELPGLGAHARVYELITDGQRAVIAFGLFRADTSSPNVKAMMQILASVRPGQVRAPPPSEPRPPAPAAKGGIPYAQTKVPLLDPKFRPSGQGATIPPASLSGGVPKGLWWNLHMPTGSVYPTVFLADGTVARFPRPGGPMLIDLDGMRALGDAPYIGRARVSGGVLTADYGEYVVSKPIEVRSSSEGPYFLWNHDEYHPAVVLGRDFLVGTWRLGAQGTYTFRADGTVSVTPAVIEAQWSHPGNGPMVGTWYLEGYLLALQFADDARVYGAFQGTNGALIVNQAVLTRER